MNQIVTKKLSYCKVGGVKEIHVLHEPCTLTWHTGGYPQCDLNAVNGRLSDVEVRIRATRDHAAKDLALEWEVSGRLILVRVSLVGLKQLE